MSLIIVFLSASVIRQKECFRVMIKALLFAGLVNVAYCLWVLSFGDFIGWNNPSGKILGTFGNQNFVSAFLGMFCGVCFAYLFAPNQSRIARSSILAIIGLTVYEIESSKSIQGLVVVGIGLAIVLFFFIRSKFSKVVLYGYSILATATAVLAVLGTLQIGPLTAYLYKNSVSLRGQYWLAGWNAGESNPLTGVGMDSFGDWYRRTRDVHALEVPGPNTVVNTAHNVFMDMFAFGGWPLFLTYLSLVLVSGYYALRILFRTRNVDPLGVSLISAWIGYQAQSVISINQIGLASWGWLLGGAVIAYEKSLRQSPSQAKVSDRGKVKAQMVPAKAIVSAFCFALLGFLVASPPLIADAKWRASQVARSLPETQDTMKSGYFNPQNSTKFLINIQTLEASSLFDLSHKYAIEAVRWNPEAFELWKVFFLIKNSTPDEKAIALENMKRLDPLNPDVTSTK